MISAGKTAAITILVVGALVSMAALGASAGHGHEYRTYHAGGETVAGRVDDSYSADLVLYLADHQCMVMDSLITGFQARHPEVRQIYVQTTPAGKILKQQILTQGEVDGKPTARNPDLFASANFSHLRKLWEEGLMQHYMVYAHNKLELMVAEGNPKRIIGPRDLTRDDLSQSHPNPVTERIFADYGTRMLRELGLYEAVTGGEKCRSCWAVPGKTWFTARHQGETPARIEQGLADVGIVWSSEVPHARAAGRKVEGVAIPAPWNMAHEVSYAIGPVATGRNRDNARKFMQYLTTSTAQAIYARYGFEKAHPDELVPRSITTDFARR